MKANPELAKNCVYALYKASNWRTANPAEALRIAERFCGQPEGVFLETVQYFPTREDFKNWFANPNAAGYSYLRSLYNERLPNLPQGVAPKPFEQAFDIEYMLQAIKEL
jgi:ABC-type nitrate/sulfonate/bicarbonate transport system substrate-binding protein